MTKALATIETAAEVVNTELLTENLIARWLRFAAVSEKSEISYKKALKQLCRYFKENEITAPKREDVENFRDGLIEAGKSPATVSLYLTAAKLFFRWLAMEGFYPNITDNLKGRIKPTPGHKKDALTKSQAKNLLKSVEGNTVKDLRDKAIIGLMLTCGLRTVEVVRADVSDIRGGFLFVQGKGRSDKVDRVKLAPQVEVLIKSYLKARKAKATEPLFVAISNRCKGKRLDTQTISKLVKAHLRGIGLDSDRLTAHSLRHTAATTMIIAGCAVEDVQMVLRHRSISTTQIYRHDVDRLKNNAELTAANEFFG